MPPPKKRVLFVCTHNSARSQIAEGLLRAWADARFEVFSAGTDPTDVRPEAIAVMAEIGVDITAHRAKHLDEFRGQEFSWLITVCDRAWQECSAVPGVENPAHWGIEDPAEAGGDWEERLAVFRRVHSDIGNRLHMFILAAGRPDLRTQESTVVG
jgi:arsenate reductase